VSLGGLACQPVALRRGLTWDGRVRSVSWGTGMPAGGIRDRIDVGWEGEKCLLGAT